MALKTLVIKRPCPVGLKSSDGLLPPVVIVVVILYAVGYASNRIVLNWSKMD
jgi:hypothetical protein